MLGLNGVGVGLGWGISCLRAISVGGCFALSVWLSISPAAKNRIGARSFTIGIAYMHDGFEVRSLAFDFAELAGLEGVNKEAP